MDQVPLRQDDSRTAQPVGQLARPRHAGFGWWPCPARRRAATAGGQAGVAAV